MAPDLRRILWLASFPKSGNTWTRSFLANYFSPQGQSLDINHLRKFTTADVRQDFFDRAAGRPFVARDFDDWLIMRQKALALIAGSKPGAHFVKTHSRIDRIGPYDLIPPAVTAGAIYILRNPFDVALSYSRHLGLGVDETIERMLQPKAINTTPTRIFEVIGRWDDHIASWMTPQGLHRHLMRYEEMTANPSAAFTALLTFLRAPIDPARLARAIAETSFEAMQKHEAEHGFIERPATMERFFAKGQSGAWRDDLTPPQIARLRDGFAPALKRWYPELASETAP